MKVWINKGEIMPEGFDDGDDAARETRLGEQDQAAAGAAARREGLGAAREGGRRGAGPRGPRPRAAARAGGGRVAGGGRGGGRPRRRPAAGRAERPRTDDRRVGRGPRAAAPSSPPVADARAGRTDAPTRRADAAAEDPTKSRRRRATQKEEKLMLLPRKTKFRKQQRGRRRGVAKGQQQVNFGEYGLKSLEPGWVTNRQIEAARIAMTRKIKRGGKVWINVFPDKPVSQKPAETRMGSGKGSPEHWVAVVKPGRVMFELAGVPEELAREACASPA